MNIEKSVWKQLGKINPEFLTGNDYPSRAEFFKAKAAALVAELENLGNKFEKCMKHTVVCAYLGKQTKFVWVSFWL